MQCACCRIPSEEKQLAIEIAERYADTWNMSLRVLVVTFSLVVGMSCGSSNPNKQTRPRDEVFTGQVGTVLFVTQVPIGGLGSVVGAFNNHLPGIENVTRGGDLMIRYPDGELRNLTREAGYGDADEEQGTSAIAVREPTVHWNGNRALFSMVIGAPKEQYARERSRWQIYEVSGLAKGEQAVIEAIAGQPKDYNNTSAIYGSDDAILFTSDRPRSGESHHYPPLDEYESMETNIGIYRLEADGKGLSLIEHSPSGAFNLALDTHGRIIFTKWDHLQRDQQGDTPSDVSTFRPVTHADESANASTTMATKGQEMFPEPRNVQDPDYDSSLEPHRFNHFFVWEVNQDGSEEETLNHVGRQEWGGSFTNGSIRGDSSLSSRAPDTVSLNALQLPDDGGAFHTRQDATDPAWYLSTIAPEFATGCSGYLVRLEGDPEVNPEDMRVIALTKVNENQAEGGRYRNPLRLNDGTLLAVHSHEEGLLENEGSLTSPDWNYDFRIKVLEVEGEGFASGATLTSGIERSIQWWTPDQRASWSGVLWELDPVEVAPRPRPPMRKGSIPDVEQSVFADLGVDPDDLREWMSERDLALIISRNVTARDRNDVQQPFRLTVPGGVSSAGKDSGYDISHLQIFQADYVRSYDMSNRSGRRALARPMRGSDLITDSSGPEGSVAIGLDGSMAAFVPARRALSWQLVSPDQEGVVRERSWISFGSGEIRVCQACHGVNKETRQGTGIPDNEPAALRSLLETWKSR